MSGGLWWTSLEQGAFSVFAMHRCLGVWEDSGKVESNCLLWIQPTTMA